MNEKVESSATHKNATIHVTNFGRFIVEILGVFYPPVNTMMKAWKIIDDYWKSRRN